MKATESLRTTIAHNGNATISVVWSILASTKDDDDASTGESEGMDTDEEYLAPPGEEEKEEKTIEGI